MSRRDYSGPLSILLLPLSILTCSSLSAQTRSADEAARQAYEQRIRTLEERVASLEQTLSRFLDREAATAAEPLPPPGPPVAAVTPQQALPSRREYEPPPELVPEIGKIGAQVGVTLSRSLNPFQLNSGSY